MDELGIGRSKVKPILGQVGERLGRLKPNGQLRGYSPLGRVIDLEVLILGITGKRRLWMLLDELLDGETAAAASGPDPTCRGPAGAVEDLQGRAAKLL